jgi:hypothetical protein
LRHFVAGASGSFRGFGEDVGAVGGQLKRTWGYLVMRIDTHGTTMLLSFSAVRLRVRYISTQDFAESIQDVAPSE